MQAVSTTTPPTPPQISPTPLQPSTSGTSNWKHVLFVIDNYFRYILSKGLVILLTVYSFYATWEVTLFIIMEYPELQERFAEHLITRQELDQVIAGVGVTLLATAISAFLAIRLSTVEEKLAHSVDIIVTTLLILFQAEIRLFLLSLPIFSNWSAYVSF